MKVFALFLLSVCFFSFSYSQSTVKVRNNSWSDLEIGVRFSEVIDASRWELNHTRQVPWQTDLDVFSIDRDTAVVGNGDSLEIELWMASGTDTAHIFLKLVGDGSGSQMQYAAGINGFQDSWQSDGNFHQIQQPFAGKDLVIKYKPDNDDSNQARNLLFVLHELPEYELDSADFANPNVINVMSYNIKMLPLFIGGTTNNLRAGLIPDHMYANLDVVIFQEAFDPLARDPLLEPGMEAAGFIYNSGILNNYFPFNGGVIIYSRWPIETTNELDFALCGPNSGDCFANKGIMYAAVNKLGKRYHIFGTHMDAGSGPDDLEAKNLQFAEMRDFIASQNIPPQEAVIYGGDFNVAPTSGANLYTNMLDSLNPVLPDYSGFQASTMSVDTGDIIDNCWGDPRYLLPLEAENEVLTLRGIEDDMWEESEFSDHRTVLARFAYPEVSFQAVDTTLCDSGTISLSVSVSGVPETYQWYRDGQLLAGATGSNLTLNNFSVADSGFYICRVGYEIIRGTLSDPINQLFFFDGPDTLQAELDVEVGLVAYDCAVGRVESEELEWLDIFPNPSDGMVFLRHRGQESPMQVEVFDQRGKLCLSQGGVRSGKAVKLDGLRPGLYLIRVMAKGKIATKRIRLN